MNKKIYQSKFLAIFLIYCFILLITTEAMPNRTYFNSNEDVAPAVRVKEGRQETPAAQKGRFERLIEEGKKLFLEEMDFERAIRKFKEAEEVAIAREQKAEVYFYLSLIYYSTLEEKRNEEFIETIRKLIEIDYYREPDMILCPPKYIEMFQRIKNEYGSLKVLSKPSGADVYINDSKNPIGKTPLIVGHKEGYVKIRIKRGNKEKIDTLRVMARSETTSTIYKMTGGLPLKFILGGILIVGGGTAALFFLNKRGGGNIQVNSVPTGASVFLDGHDENKTTNCTLTNITPGTHKLKLIKEGYEDYEEDVLVTAGETKTVNIILAIYKLKILNPNANTIWTKGHQEEIKWTYNGFLGVGGDLVGKNIRLNSKLYRIDYLPYLDQMRFFQPKVSIPGLSKRESQGISLSENNQIILSDSAEFQKFQKKFCLLTEDRSSPPKRMLEIGGARGRNRINIIKAPVSSELKSQMFKANGETKTLSLTEVTIHLYEGDEPNRTITGNIPNYGTHIWTVPTSVAGGSDYKVILYCASEPRVLAESDKFTIEEKSITITNQTSNTIWSQGNSVEITWISKGTIPNIKIDLYKGTALNQTIIDSTSNSGSYTWTVPTSLSDGSDYKVRVSSASDSSVYGESVAFKIETKSINVFNPTNATIWTKGHSVDIAWTSKGVINNVKIDLYKETALIQTIVASVANSGSYTWTVDSSLLDGTDYKVRISCASDSDVYAESAVFKIEEKSITVTEPIASTIWSQGYAANITWTSKGSISNVKLDLYKGTALNQTIIDSASNSGSYIWTVPTSLSDGSDYKVRISCVSDAAIYGESAAFKIETKSITVTNPTSSTIWSQGTSANITWTSQGTISNVKIDLYKGTTLNQTIVASTSNNGSYTWATVPTSLADGMDYKVRVSSVSDSSVYGESAAFKIEAKSITVTKPTNMTIWSQGYSVDITWTSTGAISNVKIDLYKGAALNQTIIASTSNSGSYIWTVPTSLSDGSDYKVRISCVSDAAIYGESAAFKIETKSITVTNPTSSTIWSQGTSANITWTSQGTISNVKIDLYKGGALNQTIAGSTDNDGSYTWAAVDPSLSDSSTYQVRISDISNSSVYAESDLFRIETKGETMFVTNPTSSTIWSQGDSVDITWVPTGAISNVKIYLYKGTTLIQTIVASTSNSGSYTWATVPTSLADGTDYKVRVSSVSDSSVYGESAAFKIEAKSITVTKPMNMTIWSQGDSIDITWTSTGAISNVKIDLYKGAALNQTIVASTSNTGSYTWTVPLSLTDGSDYKVKVFGANDPSVYGDSAEFKIEAKSINVTKPTSTTIWSQGDSVDITWTSAGAISNMKIDLYKGIALNQTIMASTSDSGSYTWTVTSSLADGSDYKVRVSDANSSSVYGDSAEFKIEAKSINVTKPTSTTIWSQGDSVDITWTSAGAISSAKIDLYKGIALNQTIVASTSNTGSYIWTVPASIADGSDYKVRVSDANSSSVYAESVAFKIEAKSITVTNPTSSTIWTKGYQADITWTTKGAITNVKIDLYKGNTLQETIIASTKNDGAHTWIVSTSLANGSDYKVRISNEGDSSVYGESNTFQITHGYEFICKWGSNGNGNSQFNFPRGVGVDSSGYVYVADYYNHRIQKFTSNGNFITTWGSYGVADGQFNYPWGIAIDNAGYVYVADVFNNRIQKFTSDGMFVTKWGNWGTGIGQFSNPKGIALDNFGYVYITDYYNHRIQKFSLNGNLIKSWGSEGSGDGEFEGPIGIKVDISGYVYVVDSGNNRIQKFTSDGMFVTKWGNWGTGNGQLKKPMGIEVDSSNYIYVVDSGNNRIQKFTSSGTYVTMWGNQGNMDGQFDFPTGIAVDGFNCVYISDSNNHRIQKFQPKYAIKK